MNYVESTRVIYRAEKDGEIVAVLPDEPANRGRLVCYSHVGQHGECCFEWYRATRPAKPEEYQALHEELINIYSVGEEPVRLDIRKRINVLRYNR